MRDVDGGTSLLLTIKPSLSRRTSKRVRARLNMEQAQAQRSEKEERELSILRQLNEYVRFSGWKVDNDRLTGTAKVVPDGTTPKRIVSERKAEDFFIKLNQYLSNGTPAPSPRRRRGLTSDSVLHDDSEDEHHPHFDDGLALRAFIVHVNENNSGIVDYLFRLVSHLFTSCPDQTDQADQERGAACTAWLLRWPARLRAVIGEIFVFVEEHLADEISSRMITDDPVDSCTRISERRREIDVGTPKWPEDIYFYETTTLTRMCFPVDHCCHGTHNG